jgi:hypothetical protein
MSPQWSFAVLVYLSVVVIVGYFLWERRQPKPKAAKTPDELETLLAQYRLRLTDVEDKLEHFIKRNAVRIQRDAKDTAQSHLDLGIDPLAARRTALADLRAKLAEKRGAV